MFGDDFPAVQRGVFQLLSLLEHPVARFELDRFGVIAADGREALAALDKEPFDLVFMDVQMPGLDGFEVTKALREKEKTTGKHLRIVAMTAHALKGDRERCLAAGMDGYIAKPIHVKELLQAVEATPNTELRSAPTRT